MTETPGQHVRAHYIKLGANQERQAWLEAVAACREALNEIRVSTDNTITKALIATANETLDNVERLADANTNL